VCKLVPGPQIWVFMGSRDKKVVGVFVRCAPLNLSASVFCYIVMVYHFGYTIKVNF
jgi:hypothetical protein